MSPRLRCRLPSWGLAFRQGLISRSMYLNLMAVTQSVGTIQMLETRHFGRDAEIQHPGMANQGPRQVSLYPYPLNYGQASQLNQTLVQPPG